MTRCSPVALRISSAKGVMRQGRKQKAKGRAERRYVASAILRAFVVIPRFTFHRLSAAFLPPGHEAAANSRINGRL